MTTLCEKVAKGLCVASDIRGRYKSWGNTKVARSGVQGEVISLQRIENSPSYGTNTYRDLQRDWKGTSLLSGGASPVQGMTDPSHGQCLPTPFNCLLRPQAWITRMVHVCRWRDLFHAAATAVGGVTVGIHRACPSAIDFMHIYSSILLISFMRATVWTPLCKWGNWYIRD